MKNGRLTHQHNVPVYRRFYKVAQSPYKVELKVGGGEVESFPRTFTVIGDRGSKDYGNLYAWLDPVENATSGEDRLVSTFE
jgi:hypothetical protein